MTISDRVLLREGAVFYARGIMLDANRLENVARRDRIGLAVAGANRPVDASDSSHLHSGADQISRARIFIVLAIAGADVGAFLPGAISV